MKIKPIEELKFSDDFMFCTVMKSPELCKGVIERLLKIKVGRIEYPQLQKEIRPYYTARGIRLDVYVKDNERIFDIEIQTTVPENLPKRMRYYQSMIDIDSLIKGDNYLSLKESYVIFLCTKDPFGLKLPVYTFKNVCQEFKDFNLNDGVNKILFNASAASFEKNIEIRNFLSYLSSGKPSDFFTQNIENRVEELKINEIFRSDYMMEALPLFDARRAGLKEGIALGEKRGFSKGEHAGIATGERKKAVETTKQLLKMNLGTIEQIATVVQLSIDEVLEIKKKMKK